MKYNFNYYRMKSIFFPIEKLYNVSDKGIKYIFELIPELKNCVYNAWIVSINDPSGIRNKSSYRLRNGDEISQKYYKKILTIGKTKPSFFQKKFKETEKLSLSEWFSLTFVNYSNYVSMSSPETLSGEYIYLDADKLSSSDGSEFVEYYLKNFDHDIYYKHVGKVIKINELNSFDDRYETIKRILKIPSFADYLFNIFSVERENMTCVSSLTLSNEEIKEIQKKVDDLKII